MRFFRAGAITGPGHCKGGMIQAVIFDFNGVLVDDEAVHFELFREVLAEEGVVITDRDYHERYLGYDDRGCFAAALGDAGQAFDHERLDGLIAEGPSLCGCCRCGPPFFPLRGPDPGLNRGTLASGHLLRSAYGRRSSIVLERLNRRAQVAAIIAAEDAHKCKPDPAGYLQSLNVLQTHFQAGSPSATGTILEARECLVVEDSLAGIISAKGAGMWAVGITHTYSAPQLRQSGADAIIHGLEILTPEWIDHHFARDPRATW